METEEQCVSTSLCGEVRQLMELIAGTVCAYFGHTAGIHFRCAGGRLEALRQPPRLHFSSADAAVGCSRRCFDRLVQCETVF